MNGIQRALARRNDEEALARLLDPLPAETAKKIRKVLERDGTAGTVSGMIHDEQSTSAFFFVAYENVLDVWTFRPATSDEAAQMWDLIEESVGDSSKLIDSVRALSAYREATGREAELIH